MTKNSLQPRRYQAHLIGTTYVCALPASSSFRPRLLLLGAALTSVPSLPSLLADDYPDLFLQSLRKVWADAAARIPGLRIPSEPLTAKELVLDENNELQEVSRPPGSNTCGMVAWVFTMRASSFRACHRHSLAR